MAIHPGGSQLNIANGIREFAHATPRTIAVIDGDRTLTFGAINERASRLASGLLKAGLKKGDTVALLLGNRHTNSVLEVCRPLDMTASSTRPVAFT